MLESLRNKYHHFRIYKKRVIEDITGNHEYKKFVIISDSRTGSTLLLNMLGFNPNIEVEGEKFKNLYDKSGLSVWNEIFKKRLPTIKQVGFKLFYFHSIGEDKTVWNLLIKDSSITIIHLTRDNILRSLISKKIGLKTGKWTENINTKEKIDLDIKKVKLDPLECEDYFNQIKDYQNKTNLMFQNHNLIAISYEKFILDPDKNINEIYSKLGVHEFHRKSELKKQNPEKLEDLIINYLELKAYFDKTEWSKLFVE